MRKKFAVGFDLSVESELAARPALAGSVAEAVVRRTPFSVLVTPSQEASR
jgi:nucleotide-binding universal stress UspA family protein